MRNIVEFYVDGQKYFVFSNYTKVRFMLDGCEWQSLEHYYQATKFKGTHHYIDIMMAVTPRRASLMGHDKAESVRSDWAEVKEEVMLKGLRAIFTQNESLKELLLSTTGATLTESSRVETFRDMCRTETSRLGDLLVQLRKELKKD